VFAKFEDIKEAHTSSSVAFVVEMLLEVVEIRNSLYYILGIIYYPINAIPLSSTAIVFLTGLAFQVWCTWCFHTSKRSVSISISNNVINEVCIAQAIVLLEALEIIK
jgi:hypothetical protein